MALVQRAAELAEEAGQRPSDRHTDAAFVVTSALQASSALVAFVDFLPVGLRGAGGVGDGEGRHMPQRPPACMHGPSPHAAPASPPLPTAVRQEYAAYLRDLMKAALAHPEHPDTPLTGFKIVVNPGNGGGAFIADQVADVGAGGRGGGAGWDRSTRSGTRECRAQLTAGRTWLPPCRCWARWARMCRPASTWSQVGPCRSRPAHPAARPPCAALHSTAQHWDALTDHCPAHLAPCPPDGSFPNHTPNPEDKAAVAATRAAVLAAGADLGIMLDTDVDRSGVVDRKGNGAGAQRPRGGAAGCGTAGAACRSSLTRPLKAPCPTASQHPTPPHPTLFPGINRNRYIALMSAITLRENPGETVVTDSCTSNGLAAFIQGLGGKHFRRAGGAGGAAGAVRWVGVVQQGGASGLPQAGTARCSPAAPCITPLPPPPPTHPHPLAGTRRGIRTSSTRGWS